ncbi:MAG TPA: TraI/MobA(P) family conjugative relaxase [Acetobacteraceae bacterium]|nr:TraI/MobA(P) family conjugative relaxase [Acetobacteraceae bacterium]
MIAKRIMAPKGGAGFGRLGAYVLNARAEVDPGSWTRLNAYILDTGHAGEKVAWARVTNCQTDDPGWAVKEILSTQARNTRSRSDKSYHLVVSFPEGEKPSRTQMEDIEDRLCEAIGFEAHQRVSAVHQNTDNWHLHVAINKVHPTTFRNLMPVRDHYRLQAACAELEVRHGLTREPHTVDPRQERDRQHRGARGRAADFEAQHGGQSFAAWVQEHAAAALLAARASGKGWPELHRVAASHNLAFKPRGAGLVIGDRGDARLHVKASAVDRGLSMAALTSALGPFQPAAHGATTAPAQTSYVKPGRTGPLYEAFQRERAAAIATREAAIRALRDRHAAYDRQLRTYHRDRLRQERLSGLRGILRRDSFRHIAEQRRRDHADRKAREAEERRRVRAEHHVPTWQGFLEVEAARGNEAALRTLRARQQQRVRLEAALFAAADAGEARHIVYQHLRPAIRRDGRVIYRVADGGLVSDEAQHVRVNQVTAGAAYLALTLAADRFGNRPLQVHGTEDFRQQVAQLAGAKGLVVTFADAGLERQRRAMATTRTNAIDRGAERD